MRCQWLRILRSASLSTSTGRDTVTTCPRISQSSAAPYGLPLIQRTSILYLLRRMTFTTLIWTVKQTVMAPQSFPPRSTTSCTVSTWISSTKQSRTSQRMSLMAGSSFLCTTHQHGTSDTKLDAEPQKFGFATDLSKEVCWNTEEVKLWAFEHTHWCCDVVHDGIRVYSNQRGS